MSVLKYFKNTPIAPHRATGPKCNFFFQIYNEVPRKKKSMSPPQRATGEACPPLGRPLGPAHGRGGLSPPPSGDRGTPYIRIRPLIPSSFEPENSTKNPEKKRGVRRREAAKPFRIAHF